MVKLGYALSSEEHPPKRLVELAVRAEKARFDLAIISDHFHPWLDVQGQSPFVWSVLGAIAMRTSTIQVGTGVTCPIIRTHPAIIAQAAATVAAMMPGRFFLGLGSGEALNEHITGERWPPVDIRRDMLAEAVTVIRELWKGGIVNHRGRYYTVDNARLYSLPEQPPPIYIAADGEAAARLAARHGDGMISTAPDAALAQAFRTAGNSGPRLGSVAVCWAETDDEAVEIAFKYLPTAALSGAFKNELPLPAHFEEAIAGVRREDVAKAVVCSNDPDKHLEAIQRFADAGFDYVFVHQVGPSQEGFFEFYERNILPGRLSPSSDADAEPSPPAASEGVTEASRAPSPASHPSGRRR